MNAVKSTPCAATRRLPALLALATLVMLALPLQQARSDDFDVRTANMGLADGYWRLTARIDYHLTDKALAALDNGVALTFRVEVSASRVRRWWTNKEIIDVERDWQLSYEPLTKRYLVKYPDDREETSHATLFGALDAMGRVQGLPIVEESRMNTGGDLRSCDQGSARSTDAAGAAADARLLGRRLQPGERLVRMDDGAVKPSRGSLALAACLAAGVAGLALLTETVQNSDVFGRWHDTDPDRQRAWRADAARHLVGESRGGFCETGASRFRAPA